MTRLRAFGPARLGVAAAILAIAGSGGLTIQRIRISNPGASTSVSISIGQADTAAKRVYDAVPVPPGTTTLRGPFNLNEGECLWGSSAAANQLVVTADGAGATLTSPIPSGPAGAWRLVFRDTFQQADGPPDPDRWASWLDFADTNELRNDAKNTAANRYVLGNELYIRTTNADVGYGAGVVTSGGVSSLWTGGGETVVQATIKFLGGWGAFWDQTRDGMLNVTTDDPSNGAEYDLAEYGGPLENDLAVASNVHRRGYGANHLSDGYQYIAGITAANYNTFTMHRSVSGGFVRFYTNGSLKYTHTDVVSTRTDQEIRITQEYLNGMGTPGPWYVVASSAYAWEPVV